MAVAPGDRPANGPPPDPPKKKSRRIAPDLWAGLVPNGLNQQKPYHYWEMAQTLWQNRRHPKYAWDILNKGVCDGCALGVAGFHDWTIDGVRLCTTRLNLLQVNTMGALDPKRLALVDSLRELDGAGLRKLPLDVLDVAVLPEEEWRADDPEGRTLRDIDRPADLA